MYGLDKLFRMAAVAMIIMIIVCILAYIVQCLAWKRAMELCGYSQSIAAFIPLYNLMVLCDCCSTDDVDLIGNIHIPISVFKFWWIPTIVLAIIPFTTWLALILLVLCLGWIYQHLFAVARNTTPEEELLSGYLCAMVAPLGVIFMLKMEPVYTE